MGVANIIENNAKNYFINGSYDFWQRGGASIAVNYPTSIGYVAPDRVAIMRTGSWSVIPSAVRGTVYPTGKGVRSSLKMVGTPSAGGATIVHRYRIESFEAREIADKGFMSVSNYFRSINVTAVNVTVNYATATDNFTSVALISSTNLTMLADSSFQLKKVEDITVPPAAENGIEVVITATINTSAVATEFYIAASMINKGRASISYRRSGVTYGGEFSLSQRYYNKSYNPDVVPGTVASVGAHSTFTNQLTSAGFPEKQFPVIMRANPTMFVYSTITGAINNIRQNIAAVDLPRTTSGGQFSYNGFNTSFPSTTDNYQWQYTADAEL